MDKKVIKVSSKHRLTIPARYYEALGIGYEVECYIKDDALIIKPLQQDFRGESAEKILQDLVAQWHTIEPLMAKVNEMNEKITQAVELLISEADSIAEKFQTSGDSLFTDISHPKG